jgi:hypothetical protein
VRAAEVSVLAPSVEPAEPCAEVLSFRAIEAKPSPAAVSSASDRTAGEVIYGRPGEKIVRYGIGEVLEVR